jgi:hypothetical protein
MYEHKDRHGLGHDEPAHACTAQKTETTVNCQPPSPLLEHVLPQPVSGRALCFICAKTPYLCTLTLTKFLLEFL